MALRSRWKVPYIFPGFFVKGLLKKRRALKIRTRNSIIPSCLIFKSFYLYNGRSYMPLVTKPAMKGLKFGEFNFTRTYRVKGRKKSKAKKKR